MRQFALEHGDEDDSDDSDGNDGVSSSGRAKSGAFAAPFHFPLSFSLSLSLSLVVIIVIALAQDGRWAIGGGGRRQCWFGVDDVWSILFCVSL